MTIQTALIAALQAMGERVVVNGQRDTHQASHKYSRKYVTMTRAKGGYYFLGKGGALRVGAVVSRSNPVNEKFRKWLLADMQPASKVVARGGNPMFDMS